MKDLKEFVFDESTRPTVSCHASTLLKRKDGTFIVSWFGGMREGDNDVVIWVSVKDKDGWSTPYQVSREPNIPHWNPVLMERDDGVVVLFYKVGFSVETWQTMITESKDGGKTWGGSRLMKPNDNSGGRGPVKNKTLRLSNGWILAPASVENGTCENGEWRAFVDLSEDGGRTFTRQPFVPSPIENDKPVNLIQPTLWESEPGKVHMLLRAGNKKYVYRSDSNDYGKTWCIAYPTDIPHNNSGLDVVKTASDTLALVCNPVNNTWIRSPLSVLISEDNGKSWNEKIQLETERAEFSYPAIIADGDELYTTYTWKREKIAFHIIEL